MYIISQKNAHLVNMENIASLDVDETCKVAPAAIVAHIPPSWSITLGHYNSVAEARGVIRYIAWRQDTAPDDTVAMPDPDDIKNARAFVRKMGNNGDNELGAILNKILGGEAK